MARDTKLRMSIDENIVKRLDELKSQLDKALDHKPNKTKLAKFLPVGDRMLRPPFVSLSGLGENAAADLYSAVHPEDGTRPEFISVDELSRRCPKVSQTCFDQLKSIGALRDLPDSSQMSFFDM